MYDCAQSAITFNNLNLPTYDIHSKQSRDQVLSNFHTLAQSFVIISTKHIEKAKQQNDRISQLKQRILRCKDRIQQFESSGQALIFVSPNEYPKKYKFDPEKNVSIFRDYLVKTKVNKLDMSAHYLVKHEIQRLGEESKLKLSELNQFIIFLLGQLQGKKRTAFERSLHPSKRKVQTLGQVPHNIQYIDSLIVFNSHINPYRKYELTSNIIEVQQKDKKKELEQIEKDQILKDQQLAIYSKPGFQVDSNRFIPQQQELQMPDFQMDLDLAGIVNYDFNSQIDFMNQYADFSNIQKKNIVTDPYAKKDGSSSNISSSTQLSEQSSGNSSILPPPPSLNPPSFSGTLPPPPTLLPPPPLLSGLPPPPTLLPPPPGLPPPPSLLPPPPRGLPPAPTLLPPPPILGGPPRLGPPPSLGAPPSLPKASGGGNDKSALLAELENPNPMARLKKTVTVQKGGLKSANPPKKSKQDGQSADPNEPAVDQKPRQMSFMEALQAKIKSRFQALHPDMDSDED